ncbi:MAG TPA: CAP domain-containing protein [Isosphaeraceae bacterium]|jgi:uncharacterized protein YkwD|nr:CAP domain-containing protein [Isosphaeraceae bacterium]
MVTIPTRSRSLFGVMVLSVGLLACASDPPPRPPVEPKVDAAEIPNNPSDDPIVAALIAAHNRERVEAGLPPLAPSVALQAAAEQHARDMAAQGKMSHKGSDGSTPEARIKQAGYAYQTAGENVAAGQTTVAEVMQTWMNSPPHKKNILGQFSEIGAAHAEADDGTVYWCVDFGTPWPRLDRAEAVRGLVRALNQARSEAGLPPLSVNPELEKAAQHQAELMAEQHTFQPKSSDGLSPFERAQQSGLTIRKGSESLASGQPTPDDVVRDWMKRGAQKQSILGNFSQVGAGYATAADGTPYWCVLFVNP